jgi:cobalt-zinc-cadmium resistance protein CzcA
VTVPLEVTLAGMPKLKFLRTKSLFGLSHIRTQFEYSHEYEKARQEVINRLNFTQPLPPNVTPQISPQSPTGELYRYTLRSARDPQGCAPARTRSVPAGSWSDTSPGSAGPG